MYKECCQTNLQTSASQSEYLLYRDPNTILKLFCIRYAMIVTWRTIADDDSHLVIAVRTDIAELP